jgi:hypothetical protein
MDAAVHHRLGQSCRGNLRVMLRRLQGTVPKKCLQVEQTQRMRGVEEQGRKGRASAVTGDSATCIRLGDSCLATQQGDQRVIAVRV